VFLKKSSPKIPWQRFLLVIKAADCMPKTARYIFLGFILEYCLERVLFSPYANPNNAFAFGWAGDIGPSSACFFRWLAIGKPKNMAFDKSCARQQQAPDWELPYAMCAPMLLKFLRFISEESYGRF
jgi:hypothetical protein